MLARFLCLLLLASVSPAMAQESLSIPFDTPATIDHFASPGEWDGTVKRLIQHASGRSTTVSLKHDGQKLFARFEGNLGSSVIRFPEILIDTRNEKSSEWDNNDWWFHVSASDCESVGKPADYSTCAAVKPSWQAEPNMGASGEVIDTIEIAIPLAFIGLNAVTFPYTMGLALEVTNTATNWEYWPAAADVNDPSTWANATLQAQSAAVDYDQTTPPRWSWSSQDVLELGSDRTPESVTVRNVLGKILQSVERSQMIATDGLPSGVYFLTTVLDGESTTQSVIIRR